MSVSLIRRSNAVWKINHGGQMPRGRPPEVENVATVVSRLIWIATFGMDGMHVAPADMGQFVWESANRLVAENESERRAAFYLALFEHPDVLALCERFKSWTPEAGLRAVLLSTKTMTPATVENRVRAISRRTDALRYALDAVRRDPDMAVQRTRSALLAAERSSSRCCVCGTTESQVLARPSPTNRRGYEVDSVVCHACMMKRLHDPWIWQPAGLPHGPHSNHPV